MKPKTYLIRSIKYLIWLALLFDLRSDGSDWNCPRQR